MWDVVDRETGQEYYWSSSKAACELFVLVNVSLNCKIIFISDNLLLL